MPDLIRPTMPTDLRVIVPFHAATPCAVFSGGRGLRGTSRPVSTFNRRNRTALPSDLWLTRQPAKRVDGMTGNNPQHWPRAVAFWTIVGGIASLGALVVAIALWKSAPDSGEPQSRTPGTTSGLPTNAPPAATFSTASLPARESTGTYYLSDLEPIGISAEYAVRRAAAINGTTYNKSVVTQCGDSSVNAATYTLSGRFKTFTAVVGLEDKWGLEYTSAVSIIEDGKTVKTVTVGAGKSQEVTVEVSNAVHLELHCDYGRDKKGTSGNIVEVTFADGKLERK